jgi:hypothetical protein
MYIPELVTLPPISLRRRVFANLVQALPSVATVFQDAQALLELVPFASLADALQLPSQEAAKRLKAIHQHLLREPQSVASSQLVLGSISAQTLVDVVTEYFPFHSKTARSLLSFKGTAEFDGCSITQVLALSLREEWPLFLRAAGIEGECLDRIIQVTWWFFPLAFQRIRPVMQNRKSVTLSAQVAASFKMMPIMFCGARHKCRPVEGATLSGKTCGHCKRPIADSAVSCGSCAFFLCSRCRQQPNFSTAELRAQHPAPRGCGVDCRRSHSGDGPCLVCGRGICICPTRLFRAQFARASRFAAAWAGFHSGHTCVNGRGRGSWISAEEERPSSSARPPSPEMWD